MNLFCVGLSHHNTDVEMRERFTGNAETDCVLRHSGCVEALVLTTCNRVEVYGVSETRVSTLDIARCLARTIDKHIPPDSAPFYRYEDAQCAQHLFRVASGLDSMVVGETEILGQAKKAYESARKSGAQGSPSSISTPPSSRRRRRWRRIPPRWSRIWPPTSKSTFVR